MLALRAVNAHLTNMLSCKLLARITCLLVKRAINAYDKHVNKSANLRLTICVLMFVWFMHIKRRNVL